MSVKLSHIADHSDNNIIVSNSVTSPYYIRGYMIVQVCLFVCYVRYDFTKTISPIFMLMLLYSQFRD